MTNDRTWLALAYQEALRSPDPSTQNGSILVDRIGEPIAAECNRFPNGVYCSAVRLERPLKYEMIEHAERNAIFAASRIGHATQGGTLYCPWSACADCARAIIQAGITKLVRHHDATVRGQGRNWDGSISVADIMLSEARVEIVDIEGTVCDGLKLLHSGEIWAP